MAIENQVTFAEVGNPKRVTQLTENTDVAGAYFLTEKVGESAAKKTSYATVESAVKSKVQSEYLQTLSATPASDKTMSEKLVVGELKKRDDAIKLKADQTVIDSANQKIVQLEQEVSNVNFSRTFEFGSYDLSSWKFETSTFSGWGQTIGKVGEFNAIRLCVKNRDTKTLTKIRVVVKHDIAALDSVAKVDTTINTSIPPGAESIITITLPITVNADTYNYALSYFCDALISVRQLDSAICDNTKGSYYSTYGDLTTSMINSTQDVPFLVDFGMVDTDKIISGKSITPHVVRFNERFVNETSTFSGWGQYIGVLDGVYNCVSIRIKNRDTKFMNFVKMRIVIAGVNVVEVLKNVAIPPNEYQDVLFEFPEKTLRGGADLEFLCNRLCSRYTHDYNVSYVPQIPNRYNVFSQPFYYFENSNLDAPRVSLRDNAGYYGFSYQIGTVSNNKINTELINTADLPISKSITYLPDNIYSAVGDTLQIFYKGMVDSLCFDTVARCDIGGKDYRRYFEIKPSSSTTSKIAFVTRDIYGNNVDLKEVNFIAKTPANPSTQINIASFGDSNTEGGQWVNEVARRLTKTGGVPEGHGFTNYKFVGSMSNSSGVGYFGRGGWSWYTLTQNSDSPLLNNGVIDFANYANRHCGGRIDIALFAMTWNDLPGDGKGFSGFEAIIDDMYVALKRDFPSAKMIITSMPLPSQNGGMGYNYGNSVKHSYADTLFMNKTIFNQCKNYQRIANKHADMYMTSLAYQVDSDNVYPENEVVVNVRSTKTEKLGTNGVHPTNDGYMQYADAIYRCLVCI